MKIAWFGMDRILPDRTAMLTLSCRRTTSLLAALAAVLVVAHLDVQAVHIFWGVGAAHPLVQLFSLAEELGIGTWFSTLLLFLAACALGLIATYGRGVDEADWSRWAALSGLFLFLSADEASRLHERTAKMVPDSLTDVAASLGATWVIFGAAFVVLVGVVFLPFVLRLPRRTRQLVLVGGALFVTGALGVEVLTAQLVTSQDAIDSYGHQGLIALEEGLEMAGVIVFIHALLGFFETAHGEVRLRFSD